MSVVSREKQSFRGGETALSTAQNRGFGYKLATVILKQRGDRPASRQDGIPTIFPAFSEQMGRTFWERAQMQRIVSLHSFPFKDGVIVYENPSFCRIHDENSVYVLSDDDRACLKEYLQLWEGPRRPWQRLVAALESIGMKPVSQVSAQDLFPTLERLSDRFESLFPDARTKSTEPSTALAIERFSMAVMNRWSMIDSMIQMDLYRPAVTSRLKTILEEWQSSGEDDVYQLRNEALNELDRGDESSPLFDDCRRRVNEMADNFSKKLHSAREVAKWLEDGSGPRKDWSGDWVETLNSDGVRWCADWLESKFAEIEAFRNRRNNRENDQKKLPQNPDTLECIRFLKKHRSEYGSDIACIRRFIEKFGVKKSAETMRVEASRFKKLWEDPS